jgi:transcriptional regulator with XRE-family HTH domain
MGKEPHNRQKMPKRKAFGLKVRMRRFEIGITQEELAEKADLHPTYLGSVERGERNIALESIIAIAKALGCSPKELMPD